MRIAQLLLDGSPYYERKSQQLDRESLSAANEVGTLSEKDGAFREGEVIRSLPEFLESSRAEILHVYGPPAFAAGFLRGLPVPWVSSGAPLKSRVPWRRVAGPAACVSPLLTQAVPEAVEQRYATEAPSHPRPHGGRWNVGSCFPGRPRVRFLCEATMVRLSRFRDDIDWLVFDDAPSPEELSEVALWVDPAVDETDFDGFTAEALFAGRLVAASRTEINRRRLENGASGILFPPDDPNELAHAVLTSLFRPEVSEPRLTHAKETASRFDPARRAAALTLLYESVLR